MKLPLTTLVLSISLSSAQAIEVRSSVNASAHGTGIPSRVTTTDFGPIQDQVAFNVSGDSARSSTQTDGISQITLDQYPGRVFNRTAPFVLSTVGDNNSEFGNVAGAELRRAMEMKFAPLAPELVGTLGYFRATFRYSWDLSLQSDVPAGGSAASVRVYVRSYDNYVGDVGHDSSGNGSPSQTSAGTDLWATDLYPFNFGSTFDFNWTLTASSGAGKDQRATADGTLQFWKMEVFDANRQLLTRFSDYEWYEVIGSESILSATEHMLVPEPSSILLAALGAAGLCSFRRKRRSRGGV